MSFFMSRLALRRSLAIDSEATMSPAGPPKNPLEEFAGLMGVDVGEIERFDGAGGFLATSEAPHEPAASEAGEPLTFHEDAIVVHSSGLLSGGTKVVGLDRSIQAPMGPTSRLSRLSMLGVLVAVGVAGCLGAWALMGAPSVRRASSMEADNLLKASSVEQKTAISRDDSEEQTSKPMAVDLQAREKWPSVIEEQTKSLTSAPSIAATTISTEAELATRTAATPAPAPAAPPVTRSIAPLSSAPEQSQAPAPTVTPAAAPTVSPESKRLNVMWVGSEGSVLPEGDGKPDGATPSPPPLAARTSVSTDTIPPLLHPPVPVARPSFDASARSVPKPSKNRLDAPAALSANSADREPPAGIDASAPGLPPRTKIVADSSGEKATSALRDAPPEMPGAATDTTTPRLATASAAPSGGGFSAESVLQFLPNLYQNAASVLRGSPPETHVAGLDPKPAEAGDQGAYGVQFAAPTTEPAARIASGRLRSKFAIELGQLQPTVREAEVRGRKVFQVGIGGMSRADAEALCLKLRASGGEAICSVASNY
jgi:SPOR domain